MKVTLINIQPFLSPDYPVIRCLNGFTCTINAGYGYRSEPKADRAKFYRKVEVAYLSMPYRPLKLYADNKKSYPNTSFSFVPLDIVISMINSHGGIDEVITTNQSNL